MSTAVNLLAVNVGNTRTQVGAFVEGKLIEHRRVANAQPDGIAAALIDLYEPIRAGEGAAVYLASVNDEAAEMVLALIGEHLGVGTLRVERDVTTPIGRQLDREAIVGDDRLLNAAAAYERLKQSCVVIDAGTAVTVDFVDGEGTFHGGAILPGLQMQATALHHYTTALPVVEPKIPEDPIGHNTVEAIRSGLFHGLRGAVRELVEKYAEFYGAYPKVIATGGDAELLFGRYDLIEAIVPELTLEGMAVTHRHAIQASE